MKFNLFSKFFFIFFIFLVLLPLINSNFGYNYLEPTTVSGNITKNYNITNIYNSINATYNITNNISNNFYYNITTNITNNITIIFNITNNITNNYGMDYTNVAMLNMSNDFGINNQTTSGWWNGLFNWNVIGDWFGWNGTTLSFNETKANNTYVNVVGDIMTGNLTMSSGTSIKDNSSGSYIRYTDSGGMIIVGVRK